MPKSDPVVPKKIHHLVELQAKKRPTKTGIVFSMQTLTYGELNTKANQFARYLIDHQIKPGDIVPLVANKSPTFLVAILGILKAGAAYAPINADSPIKHIESVIKETRAKYACIESGLSDRLVLGETSIIKFDELDKHIAHYSEENLNDCDPSSDLAYVIYTSGTTGNPKGGMIAHANLLPTYFSWEEAYNLRDTDIHLQMAPVGFDVFAGDWVRALCSGAILVLCPKNILIDPEKLYHLIAREKINCAEFVPAILRPLINFVQKNHYNLEQFRLLVCGSDQWTMGEYRELQKLCGAHSRVISSYGLTETTIDSSFFEEVPGSSALSDRSMVPIGKPFKHVNIYLVNEHNKPVIPGEIGEIYIGGLGVGLGYLNQLQLTQSKFVSGTFLNGISEKWYRTGDQGKLLPDGNFLFLGRNQEHIKIHGRRVDLPSLEAVINQHPKIKFGIVTPTSKPGSDEIILKCFVTLNDDSLTFEELTDYIRRELPCYYVPREFYQVETIPLSLNSKVDKRVASQKVVKELKPKYHAPQNDIQKYLINLWKEILEVETLGINNSFSDLGGSSLLFVAMLDKVNQRLKVNILANIEFETIEELSKYIVAAQQFIQAGMSKASLSKETSSLAYKRNYTSSRQCLFPHSTAPSWSKPIRQPMSLFIKKPGLPSTPRALPVCSFFGSYSQRFSLHSTLPEAAKIGLSLVMRRGR